jgi:hypothetical protein
METGPETRNKDMARNQSITGGVIGGRWTRRSGMAEEEEGQNPQMKLVRIADLLAKQRTRGLTDAEREELDRLRREMDGEG